MFVQINFYLEVEYKCISLKGKMIIQHKLYQKGQCIQLCQIIIRSFICPIDCLFVLGMEAVTFACIVPVGMRQFANT